jgi:hypothetical protein
MSANAKHKIGNFGRSLAGKRSVGPSWDPKAHCQILNMHVDDASQGIANPVGYIAGRTYPEIRRIQDTVLSSVAGRERCVGPDSACSCRSLGLCPPRSTLEGSDSSCYQGNLFCDSILDLYQLNFICIRQGNQHGPTIGPLRLSL